MADTKETKDIKETEEKFIELFPISAQRKEEYGLTLRSNYPIYDTVITFNQAEKLTDDSFLEITETRFHKQRVSLSEFNAFDVDADSVDDIMNVDDIEVAQAFKLNLEHNFAQLPSSVRKEYNNDAVAYYQDKVNEQISQLNLEAEKASLLEKNKQDKADFDARVKAALDLYNTTGGQVPASSTD